MNGRALTGTRDCQVDRLANVKELLSIAGTAADRPELGQPPAPPTSAPPDLLRRGRPSNRSTTPGAWSSWVSRDPWQHDSVLKGQRAPRACGARRLVIARRVHRFGVRAYRWGRRRDGRWRGVESRPRPPRADARPRDVCAISVVRRSAARRGPAASRRRQPPRRVPLGQFERGEETRVAQVRVNARRCGPPPLKRRRDSPKPWRRRLTVVNPIQGRRTRIVRISWSGRFREPEREPRLACRLSLAVCDFLTGDARWRTSPTRPRNPSPCRKGAAPCTGSARPSHPIPIPEPATSPCRLPRRRDGTGSSRSSA